MTRPLIRFQDVYRDAIQSLMGTNPSADQIIHAYNDAPDTGVDSIQVAGGTFYDIFAKKGRDEWAALPHPWGRRRVGSGATRLRWPGGDNVCLSCVLLGLDAWQDR